MKHDNFRDKASMLLAGKELLIILVVIFSSLSFTLGYFVGKFGKEEGPQNDFQPSTIKSQIPEAQELQAGTNTSEQDVSADGSFQSLQNIKPDGIQTVSMPKSASSDIGSQKNEPLYTVQLNALKNSVEAEKFRAKYEKKGYKTYIVISSDKNNKNIYKIRTGEFNNKNDAVMLSQKLRKTEGLSTFVTMKGR